MGSGKTHRVDEKEGPPGALYLNSSTHFFSHSSRPWRADLDIHDHQGVLQKTLESVRQNQDISLDNRMKILDFCRQMAGMLPER
jgi:hypothetical protein